MDLVTTHLSADLDGLASMVALRLLRPGLELALPGSMDPTARRFWEAEGRAFGELLALAKVRRRLEEEPGSRLYVVDTSDPARLGPLADLLDRFAEVLAYDTHPPADGFLPRTELPEAASCTSALVHLIDERGLRPSAAEAGLFLLGIHEDTGHFTFPGTRALDHRAASLCLGWGAPREWLARYVPKGYTVSQLSILERLSRSARTFEAAGAAVTIVAVEFESYEPELSVLLEQLRAAQGWPAAFLLAGTGERIDVIGRSEGAVDVARILRPLGGGGHPEAASAVLRAMTLEEARAVLQGAVHDALERRRTAGDLAVHPFLHLPASASIREAADLIHERRIDSLPLTKGRGSSLRYVGVVSRRDVDAALRLGIGARPVSEICAAGAPWISPAATVPEARERLMEGPSRLLLVGEPPGNAIGILTRGTVFRALEDPALARSSKHPPPARILARLEEALGARWTFVAELGAIAGEHGLPLHLVGGTVRDLFLELPVRDVDLAAEGEASVLAEEAARRLGCEVEVHETFGTARIVSPAGDRFDVASARFEHYERIAALPRVALHAGLRHDLFRRDFTINALAISVDPAEAGTLHDPYGGLADLEAGTLRVLHGLSFHDDPTRAFRAARFAARFDFRLAPETAGLMAAARKAGAFEELSRERLGAELERILSEPAAVQAMRLLREWRLLGAIHPRFSGGRRFVEALTRARAAALRAQGARGKEAPSQADVLWIAIASAIPRADREALQRMVPGPAARRRSFRDGPERIGGVVSALRGAKRGSHAASLLETLSAAERVYAEAIAGEDARRWIEWWEEEGRTIESSVTGERLVELGYRPGPAMGRALAAARAAARDGADPEAQVAAARAELER
ncbi:MAG TPA: CBS domain-containing protein [Vulgatibacter sp.]|nr:CBS domain-containing protein [Vulgatibacter sp.]